MSYSRSLKYGFTYAKNSSGIYKPLVNAFIKTDSVTWTPLKTAWLKIDDNTWERIYPTPRGEFENSPTTITFNTYQNYQSQNLHFLTITNVGDWNLIVNSASVNDSTGNYTTSAWNSALFPANLAPAQSITVPMNVYGNTVGTFSGNVAFTNYIGPLGYANTSVPVNVTVLPDYATLQVSPQGSNFTYYIGDTQPTATYTITNGGIGSALSVTNVASAFGYVTIGGISTPVAVGGTITGTGFNKTFVPGTTTFTITGATTQPGVYSDNIIITSNVGVATVPVTITTLKAHGLIAFTEPTTYYWTVPSHVHSIDVVAYGAGGAGGAGLPNGPYTYGAVIQGGGGGGGGSGSASVNQNLSVTPGETITVTVGAGGTPGSQTNHTYFPVSNVRWLTEGNPFANSYGVWTHPDLTSPRNVNVTSSRLFTAPYTGTYYLTAGSTGTMSILIDGVRVAPVPYYGVTWENNPLATAGDSGIYDTTQSIHLNQGNHILSFNVINSYPDDAGIPQVIFPSLFAVIIKDSSNTNLLWSTRTNLNINDGDAGQYTIVSGSFGTITVQGGSAGGSAYDDGVYYGGGGGDSGGGYGGGD
jgi:hypothetical protein